MPAYRQRTNGDADRSCGDVLGVLHETLQSCDRALRDTEFQQDIIRLVGAHTCRLTTIRQEVFQPVEGSVTYTETSSQNIHQNEMVDCQMQLTYRETPLRQHDTGSEN